MQKFAKQLTHTSTTTTTEHVVCVGVATSIRGRLNGIRIALNNQYVEVIIVCVLAGEQQRLVAFVLCYVTAIKTVRQNFISFLFLCSVDLRKYLLLGKKWGKKYYFSYSIKGKHLSLMIVVAAACLQHAAYAV